MTLTVAQRTIVDQQQARRRRHVVTPPPRPGNVVVDNEAWADLSNYTGELTDQGCAELKAAGYVGVIVQAITGLDGRTYTRQQLTVAHRNGLRLAGYAWCFPGAPESSMRSRLAMFDGFTLEFLALDVEQAGLTILDVERDLTLCDAYQMQRGFVSTGLNKDGIRLLHPAWLYSGHWYFVQQGWLDLNLWSDRPLWDSNYDQVPDVHHGFVPYGGWTKPAMKQWCGTSAVGSVHQIDLNVRAAA